VPVPGTNYPTACEQLGALTTYELRDRRRELDLALGNSGLDKRARAVLQEQLTAVITEQEERARSPWAGA
jgi:hypothetical protein